MNPTTYKIGKISYINSFPVYYGLDNGLVPEWIEMVPEPPAVLNKMLKAGQIVLSPVSSAFYGMNHRQFLLLPDLSISCRGKVMSVVLMSRFPLAALDRKRIVLTEESVTSVLFLKMLLSFRNISCRFETRAVSGLNDVRDNPDAVLVIGDAALKQPWESKFAFRIDLGEVWFEMTGMPFVFAVWAVRRSFAEKAPGVVRKIRHLFYESRKTGYENMDKVIKGGTQKLKLPEGVIREYFDHLYCDLDGDKIAALDRFFNYLYDGGLFNERPRIELFS